MFEYLTTYLALQHEEHQGVPMPVLMGRDPLGAGSPVPVETLGTYGWELVGTLPIDRAAWGATLPNDWDGRTLVAVAVFKRPRQQGQEPASPA